MGGLNPISDTPFWIIARRTASLNFLTALGKPESYIGLMSALPEPSIMNTIKREGSSRRLAVSHPQRERAYVRPVVLLAARELFRESPSLAVSLEQIAAHAGVTRHTLGNHFSSKDEIFKVSREKIIEELSRMISDEISTDLDVFDGIYHFIQMCCRIFMDKRNRELKFSLLHERTTHKWLVDAYRREITVKLTKLCETYLLYKSIGGVPQIERPRLVAEQSVMFAASVTDEYLSATRALRHSGSVVGQHIETAARAYSSMFEAVQGSLPQAHESVD